MVPNIAKKQVDLSGGAINVELGFVPSFVMLVDGTNAATVQGTPGGSVVEIVSAGGTNSVDAGVTTYDTAFYGVSIDPASFTDVGSSAVDVVAYRAQ